MPRNAKKYVKNEVSPALLPVLDTVKTVKQVQENALAFSRENTEQMVHAAQSCGEAVMDSLGLCSREMKMMAKTGSVTNETLRAVSTMAMQSATISFAHWAEFVRDAIKCGSLDDLQALQADYAHRLANDYFHEADRFWDMLIDNYEETLTPLDTPDGKRAAAA